MNMIASKDQLRGTLVRWSLLFVPSIILLGMLSAQLSGSGPDNLWFDALSKPAIYPPAAIFPLVWTVLYALMGVSLAMIASAYGARGRGLAVLVFAVQLVLNLAWTYVFFRAHQITGALILIGLLDLAVIVTGLLFRKIRPAAAWLLLPYLLWIGFATWLNWEFLKANPDLDGRDIPSSVTRIEF